MNNLPQKIFNGNNGMPKINTGQEALFLLISKKLKEKQIIQYEETKQIYTSTVQRSEYTTESSWDNIRGEWVYEPRKYQEWEIEILVYSWLLRALGALIKKGYLAVIPRIELSNKIKGQVVT